MSQKTQIRAAMKTFLESLTPAQRHLKSLEACRRLAETHAFRESQLIMLFLSMPSELETSTLALQAWKESKSIAVPRTDWKNKKLEPLEIRSLETTVAGSVPGLREPSEGTQVPLGLIDLVIIPGLAFDRHGYRVGRGKGFYDRFLSQRDFKSLRCALCFHEQLLSDPIPYEAHDVPMDLIVTDREVVHCRRER